MVVMSKLKLECASLYGCALLGVCFTPLATNIFESLASINIFQSLASPNTTAMYWPAQIPILSQCYQLYIEDHVMVRFYQYRKCIGRILRYSCQYL